MKRSFPFCLNVWLWLWGEATFVRQIGTKLKVYLYDCIYQTRSNFNLNVCVIYVIVEDNVLYRRANSKTVWVHFSLLN